MKLYIICHHCRNKIYLNLVALSRQEVANSWGYTFNINCPYCSYASTYTVNEIFAEEGPSSAVGGAVLGGLIGLIGGPLGMLIGGAVGGLAGSNADEEERKRVGRFNNGWYS